LRDSAKMDANEFAVEVSPIHIHHAVVETLRPFTQVLEEKKQTLINNVRDDLPLVMGDQTRLIQVLTNLVSNAHKYSPEETAITLDAEVRDNFVSPQGTRRGKMLVLSVKDEGLGMSKEDQERLFKERYFRSTNPDALDQPGTGLGMMLTHGIVAKHQGDIWVESDLGEGSTFFIALPLVAEKAPEATPEAGSD
jgi:signal transduction histidine kinase